MIFTVKLSDLYFVFYVPYCGYFYKSAEMLNLW